MGTTRFRESDHSRDLLASIQSLSSERAVDRDGGISVVPEGQLRRGFLYYVERERAQPYKPVLQCNGWTVVTGSNRSRHGRVSSDLINTVDANWRKNAACRSIRFSPTALGRFNTVGEIHKESYPRLAPLAACGKVRRRVGIWIGPTAATTPLARVLARGGFPEGMEMITKTDGRGYSRGRAKHYARFHQVCVDMVEKQGVNHIKFDGLGDHKWTGSEMHARESAAMLRLLGDLRRIRPDLYLYQMNGDWASPYWLWQVDSIWRAGADILYHGEGSTRQQWITGTDVAAYKKTAQTPLLPMNCLKYHSVLVAHTEKQPGYEDQKISHEEQDVIDDIRFSFGTGKACWSSSSTRAEDTKPGTPGETARRCHEKYRRARRHAWWGATRSNSRSTASPRGRPQGDVSVAESVARPAAYTIDVLGLRMPKEHVALHRTSPLEPQQPNNRHAHSRAAAHV